MIVFNALNAGAPSVYSLRKYWLSMNGDQVLAPLSLSILSDVEITIRKYHQFRLTDHVLLLWFCSDDLKAHLF